MKIDLLYTHLITGTTTVHVNTLTNCKYESFNKYVCFLYTVMICNKVYKAFNMNFRSFRKKRDKV